MKKKRYYIEDAKKKNKFLQIYITLLYKYSYNNF